MSKNVIWVVEIKFKGETVWEPTIGGSIFTKADGLESLKSWRNANIFDKLRLSKYIRHER